MKKIIKLKMRTFSDEVLINQSIFEISKTTPTKYCLENEDNTENLKKEKLNIIQVGMSTDTEKLFIRIAFVEEDKVEETIKEYLLLTKKHLKKVKETAQNTLNVVEEFENVNRVLV